MAMSTALPLLLLLSASSSMSTVQGVEANDAAALLAFKAAAVGDGGHRLLSWNASITGGFCSWEGVTCQGKPRRVVALSLSSHGLNGVLSPAIGNMSSLKVLNLGSNMLSGAIPASLGRLQHLETLNLSSNSLSGDIPTNLSSCTSLTTIELQSNQLYGRLPPELGNKLTRLEVLKLWKNNLTGTIPTSLANLSSLSFVSLAFNQFEGTIPFGLGGIAGLRHLDLAYNHISGEPPHSIYNLSSLEVLQLEGNMLHGEIPNDIGSRFPRLLVISLACNNFTGSIPASLTNLTALQLIEFTKNRLSGHVPRTLGRLPNIVHLVLSRNRLQADDNVGWEFITSLSNSTHLRTLHINENPCMTGQLPSSIGNLSTSLQSLKMNDLGISGSIPTSIINLVNLGFLSFANNSISGPVPDSIGKLGNLANLGLYNTRMSGHIPSSIGNLTRLNSLLASNARFNGPIPASLGKLKDLMALDMSNNRLNGSIPKEIFRLPLLSRFLDLSYNSLTGPLPSAVGSLENLNQLILSGNQLSGEIPDSIGGCTVLERLLLNDNSFEGTIPQSLENLKGLNALNLSMNKLSGNIPNAIGSIRNLQQLSLAHNSLTGFIPKTLQNLTSLSELDLSFNNLKGEVPQDGFFKNLTYSSITANDELCGGIRQLHLAPCNEKNSGNKNKKGWLKSLSIALAAVSAVVVLALAIVLSCFFYKKLRRKQNKHVLPLVTEEHYERVAYHTLASGTNGFSEANLLGEGSFGRVYKCNLQGEETIAAVKVFKDEHSGSNKSFVAECDALKRVRHRCLIKIITCVSSVNHQGQEFKALVFEFMPNSSLNDWLHLKSDMPTLKNTLSLEQRLDIAVNIIDALDYLHNHCQPAIVHCDLKPSNILLREDMSACVGDFGISRILPKSASIALKNSNSTIGVRGSIGYIAPEYGEGSSISTLGDVYSLGILLLEMFTGRSPTDDMFRGSLDLHKFSEDALPERICEIADSTMWMHQGAYNNPSRSRTQSCLVSVIALGISCSKKQPRERILIHDVAIQIHAIRDSYLMFAKPFSVHEGVAATQQ